MKDMTLLSKLLSIAGIPISPSSNEFSTLRPAKPQHIQYTEESIFIKKTKL